MVSVKRPTVRGAVKQHPDIETVWVEGSNNPQDAGPGVHKTMSLAREEIERTAVMHGLPFEPEKVTVAVVPEYHAHGAATPVRCGEYTTTRGEWTCEKTPEEYGLILPKDSHRRRSSKARRTVRHELAHMADWEENLRTTEQTETHMEWLRRLDAQ
jgi:hypothetical protein